MNLLGFIWAIGIKAEAACTQGDVVYILVADAHEHLGQLMALRAAEWHRVPLDRTNAEKESGRRCEQIKA
jgi:hypothetical protein